MFRKMLMVVGTIALAGLVVLGGYTAVIGAGGPTTSVAAQGPTNDAPRVISVSGSGRAMAAPDVAYVTLGVEARDADAATAVADSTQRMQAVMAVLEEMGIDADDIQTVNYSMWREQIVKEPKERPTPEGEEPEMEERYHVVNQVRVTLRDLEQVGQLMEEALEAGANSVSDISFAVEDTSTLRSEARDAAIADARAKAEQLAAGFGVELGTVRSVSEYGGPEPVRAMRDAAYGMGGGGGVPVSAGQLAVTVGIEVSFEIAE
jgi:hypothetical protein